jgi:hypothetical protein
MSLTFRFNSSEFYKAAKAFPRESYVEEKKALERAGRSFNNRIRKEQLSGPADSWVKPRTGTMRRSMKHLVFGENINELGLTTYFDTKQAPYAPHHEGPGITTVRPKRAKWLAVPTKAAMTPSGVVRSQYAAGKGQTLRSVPGMFIVKKYVAGTKNIEWMGLAIKRGKKGIKLIYIFKKSISYRRKMRFGSTFEAEVSEGGQIFKELQAGLVRAAEKFRGK